MVLRDIQQLLETWAPRELAWERDNVGIQIGRAHRPIRKILIALEVTDRVIDEAIEKKIDLIITHHPLIYHPLKSVTDHDRTGRLATALIKHDIALYVAHTNLDFAHDGVSHALAQQLGLTEVTTLSEGSARMKKIAVFIPPESVDRVVTAMSRAGAGSIGKYDMCSFRTEGTGTFRPKRGAQPAVGRVGHMETSKEVRVEMIAPSWKLGTIVDVMHRVHPYEEVAYDVYDLTNVMPGIGAGSIGNLKTSLSVTKFLAHVRGQLGIPCLRYSQGQQHRITRVAVCGGSGSDLMVEAIRRGADAFVTSDVNYHAFQDSDNRLTLIDAGHFETEHPVVRRIVSYLRTEIGATHQRVSILAFSRSTNFVRYSLS